jgi:hypothetical protein
MVAYAVENRKEGQQVLGEAYSRGDAPSDVGTEGPHLPLRDAPLPRTKSWSLVPSSQPTAVLSDQHEPEMERTTATLRHRLYAKRWTEK